MLSPRSLSSGSCSRTRPSRRRHPIRAVFAAAAAVTATGLTLAVVVAGPAHADDGNTAGCAAGVAGCIAGNLVGGLVDKATDPCRQEPKPDDPQAGLGAVLAPTPPGPSQDPFTTGAGIYQRYGYGGYQLPVYDLGCLSGAGAGPGSFFANTFMRGMVWLVALGGFLDRVGHVHTYWDILDPAVRSAEQLAQRLLWSDGGVLSLAIGALALVCLWAGLKRRVSVCLNLAATAFLVLFLGHATAFRGVETAHWLRENVTGLTDLFHNSALDADPTPASDTVQRGLLYTTWTAAMFGDGDGPAAREYGPRLFDCLAWRVDETQDTATQNRKMACTHQLMDELNTKYPVAADYAHGAKTREQAGTTLLGFLAALCVAGWQILAGLAGLVLNAVCTFAVPAVAFTVPFALFKTGFKHLRVIGELIVGSAIKAVVCSLAAQLLAAADGAVLGAGTIPMILKVVFLGIIAAVAFWLTRRHRRLVNGAVDRQVGRVAAATEKLAQVTAVVVGATAGVPPMAVDEYPKQKKNKNAHRKDGRNVPVGGTEKATPPVSREGWVAPIALPAAGGTIPAGRPPLAWAHEATGTVPVGALNAGPGLYRTPSGAWTDHDPGTVPAGALNSGPPGLPVPAPVRHPEEAEGLRRATAKTPVNTGGTVHTGEPDRRLTGMYVADQRGLPVIDVHGWIAPTTGADTTTTPPEPTPKDPRDRG